MLVLARCSGEAIIIGDDIKITVVEVRNNKVRLGIDAPRSVSVHRGEIYLKIKETKRNAETAPPDLVQPKRLAG